MSTFGIIDRRHQLLGDFLAELHSPLIEGIDAPDNTLREYAVLVESNEPAESSRIELSEQQEGERATAGVDLVGSEGLDLREWHSLMLERRAHRLGRLAVGERFRLRQAAGNRQVLLRLVAA